MGDWESAITVGAEGAEAEAVNQRNNKFVYACSSCHKEAVSQEHLILTEARQPSHPMELQSSMHVFRKY